MKVSFWCFCFVMLLYSCSIPKKQVITVSDGIIDLADHDFKRYGKVDIQGVVPYYPDQLITKADLNKRDLAPISVSLHSKLSDQLPSGTAKGVGTYHFKIRLPHDEHSYGMFVKGIFSSYKIFINDEFEDGMGVVSANRKEQVPMVRPEIIALPLKKGFQDVFVQVANFHDNETQINFDIEIGEMHGLYADQHVMYNYDFGFSFFYCLIGLAFLVFSIINKRKLFFIFGAFSITIAYRFLIKDSKFLLELVDTQWVFFYKSEFITYYFSAILVPLILGRMLYVVKAFWVNITLFSIAALASILTLVFPVSVFTPYVIIYHYVSIGLIFLCAFLAIYHWIKAPHRHIGLGLGTLLFASFFMYDIVMSLLYYAESYYYNWGLTTLTLIMAIDLIYYQVFPRKKWNVL